MKVIQLNWISQSAKEAELRVSDGTFDCLVFSHPCRIQLNQILDEPLHALDIENLMKVIDPDLQEQITKINDSYFAHYCVAKVENIKKSIVSIGNIKIELEESIPGWAEEGDLIEFKCSRFDI